MFMKCIFNSDFSPPSLCLLPFYLPMHVHIDITIYEAHTELHTQHKVQVLPSLVPRPSPSSSFWSHVSLASFPGPVRTGKFSITCILNLVPRPSLPSSFWSHGSLASFPGPFEWASFRSHAYCKQSRTGLSFLISFGTCWWWKGLETRLTTSQSDGTFPWRNMVPTSLTRSQWLPPFPFVQVSPTVYGGHSGLISCGENRLDKTWLQCYTSFGKILPLFGYNGVQLLRCMV